MRKKPFLIITGMHRSGTSFLARALNLSGVYLGEMESLTSTDLKFFPENLRGHWESKKFQELTMESLKSNIGSWYEIPDKIKIDKKLGRKISGAVKELMNHESIATGFKDPRIIPLLDSWKKFFPKNTILIGIFRHPLEVAESLKNRDGFGYEKSLNLWKIYNEKLFQQLDQNGGFLLNFDLPKKRLISELLFIIKKLGLNDKVDLSEWYSEELLKSNKTYQKNFSLSSDITKLYSKLKKKSTQNSKVKVKKIKRTSKELEKIIQNQLANNQKLGQYYRMVNQQRLNQIKKIHRIDPISLLHLIYYERTDLQKSFPEFKKGDYSKILNWAISVAAGKNKDELSSHNLLKEFLPHFETFQIFFKMGLTDVTKIPKSNPLFLLLFTYFERPDLQNAFPEVQAGNYLNLIKWALDVGQGQVKEEKDTRKLLSKFQPWYNEYWSNYQSSKELPNKIEQINQLEKNIVEKEVFVKEAQTKLKL